MTTALTWKNSKLIVGALVMALLASSFPWQSAAAALISCRSDPLILLSDGTIVDISADIDTLLWNVTEVEYVLHIPAGLQVVLAVSTPSWPTTLEHFVVYADRAPGEFVSTTTVHTRNSSVNVTAHMLVNLNADSKSGVSSQPLTITLDPYLFP